MIGKFLAKVKDYGISTTKGGKPQVAIQFSFEHDGQTKEFSWYGTLSPDNDGKRKGIEITLKALYACGLTQQNINRLGQDFFEGPKTGILDMTKDLSIELQEETNQENKIVTKVAWVNDPNDSYVLKKVTAAENVQVMSGLNFEGDFHRIVSDKLSKNPGGQTQGNGQNQNQGQNSNQGQGQNQGQNQNQNSNQQNFNQNNNGQNQNQNFNNGNNGQNNNQNYQNQGQSQTGNQNQGQNGQNQNQGAGGFKAPF